MAMFSCLRGEKDGESGAKSSFFKRFWLRVKTKLSPRARKEKKALKKLMAEMEKEKEREKKEIQNVEIVVQDIRLVMDEVNYFLLNGDDTEHILLTKTTNDPKIL